MTREERDSLLLSQFARKTPEGKYLYVGEVHIYNSLQGLKKLSVSHSPANLRRFLRGHFVFELKDLRIKELMESPEGMAVRVSAQMMGMESA